MTALALYRRDDEVKDWTDVEVVGRYPNGDLRLREIGKFYPGVWRAAPHQIAFHQTPEPK